MFTLEWDLAPQTFWELLLTFLLILAAIPQLACLKQILKQIRIVLLEMALHWKKSDSQALSRKFVFDLRFKFEFLDYLLYINKVQQKSNLEKYASRRTFAKRAA